MFPTGQSGLPIEARSLPELEALPQQGVVELINRNTQMVAPTTDILQILPEPSRLGKHDDDLFVHQDRINAIDDHLVRVSNAVDKVFVEINQKLQKVALENGSHPEWPKLDKAMSKLVQDIDKARSQLAQGKFDLAEQTCSEA